MDSKNKDKSLHVLENDCLRVVISSVGAELQSIHSKRTEREWLWQGDVNYWGKRSPLLFPFVGTCKGGIYTHDHVAYEMPRHGFARDMTFDVKNHDDGHHSVCYELKSNQVTLERYPFEFVLEVSYRIEGNRLDVGFKIKNMTAEGMYFSIGGHPAFNADMENEAWTLTFSEDEKELELIPIDLSTGLLECKTVSWESRVVDRSVMDGHTSFLLKKRIFNEDALVFSHLTSQYTDLKSNHLDEGLRFHHGQFPFMAFWSPHAPFVCMEPWFGHADYQDHDGVLAHKADTVVLESGGIFDACYSVELMELTMS